MRGSVGAPDPDLHLNARSEPVDDRHQPIDDEPSEVRITDAREIGRGNRCAAVRATHAQALSVEDFDDLGPEDRLEAATKTATLEKRQRGKSEG